MSDRFYGEIKIGGRVPEELLPELCRAIELEDVGWADESATPLDPESLKELAADESVTWLEFCDAQAAYGQFDGLETFLREHNIAYDRRSEGKYEYPPEHVWFRPGMSEARYVFTDPAGNQVISREKFLQYAKRLQSLLTGPSAGLDHLSVKSEVQRVVRDMLVDVEPPPNLPPFEIGEPDVVTNSE